MTQAPMTTPKPLIAPCPNPECGGECRYIHSPGPFGYHIQTSTNCVRCDDCGYCGPRGVAISYLGNHAAEQIYESAIRLHNAICSSIPRAQIEALEAEMRKYGMTGAPNYFDDHDSIRKRTTLKWADRLSALLHPELKGEDK